MASPRICRQFGGEFSASMNARKRVRPQFEEFESRLAPAVGLAGGGESLVSSYVQTPLTFEVNEGQIDSRAQFLARGDGYALFLNAEGAILSLTTSADAPTSTAVAMKIVGGNPLAAASGLDLQSGTSNYFRGSDASQWRTAIANYGKVSYADVYAGIDLVYYGKQRQLEYDFVVSPGADPRVIRLDFDGAESIALNDQGDLVLHTGAGDVIQDRPVVYQDVGGSRQYVAGRFHLENDGEVSFDLGEYDPSLPLVIDPVLSYSTYLGGNDDDLGHGIAVDGAGNFYVTGETGSTNFPTTAGVFQTVRGAGRPDVFVTKFNANGTLSYSTYLGGNNNDYGQAIAVDSAGNAYVTGYTTSSDFPTTVGSFQPAHGAGWPDAFVTKLNATGTALSYSTYVGGGDNDYGLGIAVDGSGNAYVTGNTASHDFPITAGAFQTSYGGGSNDAFLVKLNASGAALAYSTFLGGSNGNDFGRSVAVDGSGNAFVAGNTASTNFPTTAGAFQTSFGGGNDDAFLAKLNASGAGLVYSTYLGGGDGGAYGNEFGYGIAVDSSGSAYVTGKTTSTNFPTTAGAFQTSLGGGNDDAFVTKLNASGAALVYSTYLGGGDGGAYGNESGYGIAVDGSGSAYVTGKTTSTNFPTTADAFQTSFGGGNDDAFLAKLNASGTALVYGSYLGGSNGNDFGQAIAVDGSGNAYVTGYTSSNNFPTTAGAFQTTLGSGAPDAFVAKISGLARTLTAELSGGNLTITDIGVSALGTAVDNVFSVSRIGANLVISDANEQFVSAPAGGTLSNGNKTLTIPISSISGVLTIDGAQGFDAIAVNELAAFSAGLTIGSAANPMGAITFAGGMTLAAGKSLAAYASGTIDLPTSTSDLAVTGTGTVLLTTRRNIVVANEASVTTVDGSLTLSANQQAAHASGDFSGVEVNGGLVQATGTGAVTVNGWGGDGPSGAQFGVDVRNAGRVSGSTTAVTGTGGASPGTSNSGIFVSAFSQIDSGGGIVNVTGVGGGSSASVGANIGVVIASGSHIAAGSMGAVTITGTGGSNSISDNYGVLVADVDSKITSNGGNVVVTGYAGNSASGNSNIGVVVGTAGRILAGGAGTVTVSGTGGTGLIGNLGINVGGANAMITSSGGSVSVTGHGGGNPNSGSLNYGVNVTNQGRIASGGAGAIAITAISGHASLNADNSAVRFFDGTIASNGNGSISVTADSINLRDDSVNSISAGSGIVAIQPRTAGTAINLSGADVLSGSPSTLGLSALELNSITGGALQIGDANTGTITVSGTITRPAATNMTLVSNADIVISGGSLDTAGGSLTLTPGAANAAVKPTMSGVDVTASAVSFTSGRDLAIDIAGTAVDSQYSQLNVAGAVNLSGADLVLTGAYVPLPGNVFTIVSASSVTGTFNGLASGSTIAFNGVSLVVTYSATSVTLGFYVAAPTVTGVAPFIGPTSGGNTVVITGAGFKTDAGLVVVTGLGGVKFGGANASSYVVNSATQITAVAPAGSLGLVDVTVTNAAGTSTTAGAANDYTYVTPPITSIVVNGGQAFARNLYGDRVAIAGQNSVVSQILVTFNQKMTLEPGAVTITNLAGNFLATQGSIPSAVNVDVITTRVSASGSAETGYTQYFLTFVDGPGVNRFDNSPTGPGNGEGNIFTTLKDGYFEVKLNGSKAHAGGAISGATVADSSEKFWVLFGAANPSDVVAASPFGDGNDTLLVDGIALSDIYATFGSSAEEPGSSPAYSVSYDWNLDGNVDGIDLHHFYGNFGTIWRF